MSPAQLVTATHNVVAKELSEDPHDLIANLLMHGASRLDSATAAFLGAYLLLHGLVKLVIIVAIIVGSRRVYPWAIAALTAFLVFQAYELFVHPSPGMALLVVLDAVIIWLTWREWRQGTTLRETLTRTGYWITRRQPA